MDPCKMKIRFKGSSCGKLQTCSEVGLFCQAAVKDDLALRLCCQALLDVNCIDLLFFRNDNSPQRK